MKRSVLASAHLLKASAALTAVLLLWAGVSSAQTADAATTSGAPSAASANVAPTTTTAATIGKKKPAKKASKASKRVTVKKTRGPVKPGATATVTHESTVLSTARNPRPSKSADNKKTTATSTASRAASPSTNLETQVAAPTATPPSKGWAAMVNISRATNLYDYQDGTRQDGMDFMARLSLNINDVWTTTGTASYSSDLKDSQNSDFGDLALGLGRKSFALGEAMTWAPSFSAIVPTSKNSTIRQNLQGALGTSVGFGFAKGLLPEGLHVGAAIRLSRLFHQYDASINGSVNTQWSSGQSISVAYGYEKFSLSMDFGHRNSITYQGNLKEAFEHTEELGYDVSEHVNVAVGHTLSGSALRANGSDSNLRFLNDNESMVYGSVTASF